MCLGTEEDEQNVLLMTYELKLGLMLKFDILKICLVGCVCFKMCRFCFIILSEVKFHTVY
jgi:hypothetical protein